MQVKAKAERRSIPTYVPAPDDKNPMFFHNRNVQGASGKIFPLPFNDKMAVDFRPVDYTLLRLENEFIDVELLPEIGGRIYAARDKTNGYDFVYRNRAIKPQQIGLAGPWVSGGIEFNWPQHHRPTTFAPVEYAVEEHPDGSATVWMGEVEPLYRMKGMVGITVRPGKSYIEAKIQLYNRTPFPQAFLWWANLAVPVNENYRAVFPEDIHWASDHAWALTSAFPVLEGMFKTHDFGAGTDVRDFKNVPIPASFFTYDSAYDFLSGYDFGRQGGIVHLADRHIGTGKKMFTWGVSDFSRAWFDNLSDEDGPYIELMTGIYSCNQPDFAWLMPGETKTAVQYWFPVRDIGEVKNANLHGAVAMTVAGGEASFRVNSTEAADRRVLVRCGSNVVFDETVHLAPGTPFAGACKLPGGTQPHECSIELCCPASGECLLAYRPEKPAAVEIPGPLPPAPAPQEVDSQEALYLHAQHIWQYKHPTFHAEDYLAEALRRDENDIRCNTLLGQILLDKGSYGDAIAHLARAAARATSRHPSAYDTEPFYHLGVAQRLQGDLDAAYESLYKAVWGYAWKTAGYTQLAEIAAVRGDVATALAHVEEALLAGGGNSKAQRLQASLLRRAGRPEAALEAINRLLRRDRLDAAAACEKAFVLDALGEDAAEAKSACAALLGTNPEYYIDVALEYIGCGMYADAATLLAGAPAESPAVLYYLAEARRLAGENEAAEAALVAAAMASPVGCLHARPESITLLRRIAAQRESDAVAPYLLGNILYSKDMFEEAIACFEASAARGAAFPTVYRNLAIGLYDQRGEAARAGALLQKAFEMDPGDDRVFYEWMQLCRATGMPKAQRADLLEHHSALVQRRDDLYTRMVSTKIECGLYDEAIAALRQHEFHPYEGGEGVVTREFIAANHLAGFERLAGGDAEAALGYFEAACTIPENFHEGKRPMRYEHSHLDYARGLALEALGRTAEARVRFEAALVEDSDSPEMKFYMALCLERLGRPECAQKQLDAMKAQVDAMLENGGRPTYFTTTLVTTLPFEHNPALNNEASCRYLYGLYYLAKGERALARQQLQMALALRPVNYLAAAALEALR